MTTSSVLAESDKLVSASNHSAAAAAASTPPTSNRPSMTSIAGGPLLAYATRLPPGADLVSSMEDFAAQAAAASASSSSSHQAGCFVLSAVGSLECVTLRMANACRRGMKTANPTTPTTMAAASSASSSSSNSSNIDDDDDDKNGNDGTTTIKTWNERLEIVSLTGTFSGGASSGGKHLHMSVSDEDGRVFGGHVISGTIYTTLELVVGVIAGGVAFSRELDATTGYRELVVRHHPQKKKQKTNIQEEHA
jgi:predicted DNA-binding protein with PD1-like motif